MTKCTHHWIIEGNFEHNRPLLSATCRLCGDVRTYNRFIDEDETWNLAMRKKKRLLKSMYDSHDDEPGEN